MIPVAYLCVPPVGGLRTFFTNLRNGLAPHGIRLFWLGSGRREAQLAIAGGLYGEAPDGVVVAPESDDDIARMRALLDYIRDHEIPVVLLNSVPVAVPGGLAFCLPAEVARIFVVHTITPMTYRMASAVRDYVHCTVAVSPRIQHDLVRQHGFDPQWTVCIPHGVGTPAPDRQYSMQRDGTPLRVLFLGRVEDQAKGVHWLPGILDLAIAAGANLQLTVAGSGPDLPALSKVVCGRGLAPQVQFVGEIPPDRVPSLLNSHDVFLMPSRFEGLGYVLLEAMAAGCVPVASRLHGVTDFVIDDGCTGFLFPMGSPRAAAECLARLAWDPGLLSAMSVAARADVRARFNLAQQTERYAVLIRGVLRAPRPIREQVALENWSVPRGFRPGWWYWLPLPAKNALRVARERLYLGGRTLR